MGNARGDGASRWYFWLAFGRQRSAFRSRKWRPGAGVLLAGLTRGRLIFPACMSIVCSRLLLLHTRYLASAVSAL